MLATGDAKSMGVPAFLDAPSPVGERSSYAVTFHAGRQAWRAGEPRTPSTAHAGPGPTALSPPPLRTCLPGPAVHPDPDLLLGA